MTVFSNTTPFISLSSVSLLELMPKLFGEVTVARSVVEECSEGGRIVVPDLAALPWVNVVAVQSQLNLPALFELDRGERDTLLLAASHAEPLVIMDEKLGRNMAEYMGLQVTGTTTRANTLLVTPARRSMKILYHHRTASKDGQAFTLRK